MTLLLPLNTLLHDPALAANTLLHDPALAANTLLHDPDLAAQSLPPLRLEPPTQLLHARRRLSAQHLPLSRSHRLSYSIFRCHDHTVCPTASSAVTITPSVLQHLPLSRSHRLSYSIFRCHDHTVCPTASSAVTDHTVWKVVHMAVRVTSGSL